MRNREISRERAFKVMALAIADAIMAEYQEIHSGREDAPAEAATGDRGPG
jgi:hypothetical protein